MPLVRCWMCDTTQPARWLTDERLRIEAHPIAAFPGENCLGSNQELGGEAVAAYVVED